MLVFFHRFLDQRGQIDRFATVVIALARHGQKRSGQIRHVGSAALDTLQPQAILV